MSRVIKFRVHCADTGKVLAYESFNTTLNWGYYWIDATIPEDDQICETASYFKHPHPLGRLIRVEFTRLHDVNGVEIYEGDVVSVIDIDYEDDRGMQDYYGGKRESRPTKEVDRDVATMERFPTFWLRNERFGYEGESLASPKDCKVIGNIYQNPELLK